MVSLTFVLVTAALAVVIYWLLNKDRSKKLPPGPWSLPLIGNLLQLGRLPHLKYVDWAEKYGSIFQVKIATQRMVLVSDLKMVREFLNDPNMSGRPDMEAFSIMAGGKHGIVASDGPEWVEQRRFTLRQLRDFGFGKTSMENLIEVEVKEYLELLKKKEGQPLAVERGFSLAVLNSLWVILTSRRYKQDDPKLAAIFDINARMNDELSNSPAIFIPWFAKRFPKISGWDMLMEVVNSIRGFSTEMIDEHKKTIDKDGEPRDFVDAYLKEIDNTTDPSSSFYKDKGDWSLIAVLGDLFSAGNETTSVTLTWLVLYLSKFPHVQKKVQEEIDRVVGSNRAPSLTDRPNLPYTEATILETLRMSSLTPFGLFHVATMDLKFHGYDIPKGTWICPNEYLLHFSKDHWKEPEVFEPTRFLSEDKKSTRRPEAFFPFSAGKRACIGESLAKDTIFLFASAIFQKYHVELAPESKDATLTPKPGFLLAPKEFKVVMKERI